MKKPAICNLVADIVYCDKQKQIIGFVKLPEPTHKKKIVASEYFAGCYYSAIISLCDGQSYEQKFKMNAKTS